MIESGKFCPKFRAYCHSSVDNWQLFCYHKSQGAKSPSKADKVGKEKIMEEDMEIGELLKQVAEENQTRKILEILNECKDLQEAKQKVLGLLERYDYM